MKQNRRIITPMVLSAWLLWAGIVALSTSAPAARAEPVLVAAASNVQFAFADLIGDFRRAHPNVDIKISFGSSGNFHSQIVHGAPYDIFFSADLGYPQKLESAGLAVSGGTTTAYALGTLVLWVEQGFAADVRKKKFTALLSPAIKKIAIANPRHAPYGRAAVAALRHFGVYERVKDRLIIGENISQTAQFADSGAVQAGILALSLVAGGKMKTPGTYWKIPTASHQPIAQGFLILKNGKNPQTAKTFARFVLSAKGQNILTHHGYAAPGGAPGDDSP